MKNDLKNLLACASCHRPYMLIASIPCWGQMVQNLEYAEGDPRQFASEDYCGPCNVRQHNANVYAEEGVREARAAYVAQRAEDHAKWREEQYALRIEEKRRQLLLADEYRASREDPDPDGWLKFLSGLADAGYVEWVAK